MMTTDMAQDTRMTDANGDGIRDLSCETRLTIHAAHDDDDDTRDLSYGWR